ncbi:MULTISPECIES: hypothetical protein [Peptostreptococcus]|uniref:hypothetical protein n=1 Tax=Peptostreptococcus TaxID=1257 RepID=UPI001896C177|nr:MULTISPECIES: hypothetical protein [Peptostreptococcus]MDB8852500.1 hypothetical protein [Peptostreptococcus anaerobius]MDU3423146.1 hypothetical protein [Peptostreptococcus anaerobius]MDU3430445.1 hypothetical protein [Peptostreptococcus sp.]MDU3455433.1 hypothetical protein [Peptostreptococcus sp.]MDU5987175.1 hypothetical protein [Peptostreptococcus anaerobius]
MINKKVVIAAVLSCVINLSCGCYIGYRLAENDIKNYIGRVVSKEHQPREVRFEKQKEWIDGELKEVENPVMLDETFTLKVEDVFGSVTSVDVTKEVYKKFEIGDKYRR